MMVWWGNTTICCQTKSVLILVLVDDGMVATDCVPYSPFQHVLILVLVDDGMVAKADALRHLLLRS